MMRLNGKKLIHEEIHVITQTPVQLHETQMLFFQDCVGAARLYANCILYEMVLHPLQQYNNVIQSTPDCILKN